eukprot:scaffold118038_cov66-Phaeocystis_antarctica.AAC.2
MASDCAPGCAPAAFHAPSSTASLSLRKCSSRLVCSRRSRMSAGLLTPAPLEEPPIGRDMGVPGLPPMPAPWSRPRRTACGERSTGGRPGGFCPHVLELRADALLVAQPVREVLHLQLELVHCHVLLLEFAAQCKLDLLRLCEALRPERKRTPELGLVEPLRLELLDQVGLLLSLLLQLRRLLGLTLLDLLERRQVVLVTVICLRPQGADLI